jgi:hypothetical protein
MVDKKAAQVRRLILLTEIHWNGTPSRLTSREAYLGH